MAGAQQARAHEHVADTTTAAAPVSVGIFRRSPSALTVQVVKDAYDRTHPVTLSAYPDDAFLAASLLKLYLRELPEPLIPTSVYPIVKAIPLGGGPNAAQHVRTRLLPALDGNSALLFREVASVLSLTAEHAKVNLMPVPNLLVCLAPCLVGGVSMESLAMTRVPALGDKENTVGGLLQVCIQQFDEVFGRQARSNLRDIRIIPASPLAKAEPQPVAAAAESADSTEEVSTPTSTVSAGCTTPPLSSATSLASDDQPVLKANSSGDKAAEAALPGIVELAPSTPLSPLFADLGAQWVEAEAAARRESLDAAMGK